MKYRPRIGDRIPCWRCAGIASYRSVERSAGRRTGALRAFVCDLCGSPQFWARDLPHRARARAG